MEKLRETLLAFKHVQVVYLNDGGEWSFNPKTGFDIVKTRLEIMDDEQVIADLIAKEEADKAKEESVDENAVEIESEGKTQEQDSNITVDKSKNKK